VRGTSLEQMREPVVKADGRKQPDPRDGRPRSPESQTPRRWLALLPAVWTDGGDRSQLDWFRYHRFKERDRT